MLKIHSEIILFKFECRFCSLGYINRLLILASKEKKRIKIIKKKKQKERNRRRWRRFK